MSISETNKIHENLLMAWAKINVTTEHLSPNMWQECLYRGLPVNITPIIIFWADTRVYDTNVITQGLLFIVTGKGEMNVLCCDKCFVKLGSRQFSRAGWNTCSK